MEEVARAGWFHQPLLRQASSAWPLVCLAWCAHIARSGFARLLGGLTRIIFFSVGIALLPRVLYLRTSQNSFKANFRESPKGEVRRILLLRGLVNKTALGRSLVS